MAINELPDAIPLAPPDALAKNPDMRLNDPAMRPTMDAIKQRIKSDPNFGRMLLRRAGIVNAEGKLKKSFGG